MTVYAAASACSCHWTRTLRVGLIAVFATLAMVLNATSGPTTETHGLPSHLDPPPHASARNSTSSSHVQYVDFYGDSNNLSFPAGELSCFVFQNHGEAFYVMGYAIATGTCPAGLSVLHFDHHDDMAVPGDGFSNTGALSCYERDDDDPLCALHNDNFLLGIIATRPGAIKRILWLYPPDFYPGRRYTAPHTCELGIARNSSTVGRRYMHRSLDANWWGYQQCACDSFWGYEECELNARCEHQFTPYLCGSTPHNSLSGMHDHREGVPSRTPLSAYEAISGASYEFAVFDSATAVTRGWWPRLLGNATWFSPRPAPGSSWILDLDADYLVAPEEMPANQEHSMQEMQRLNLALHRLRKSTARWLCNLTRQCNDLLAEWSKPPTPKPDITEAELASRVAHVRRALRQLLPSQPCLVTISRSNEGAFTPLRHSLRLEDAFLNMLRELYGPALNVQYMTSAFGSRERSAAVYAQLMRARRLSRGRPTTSTLRPDSMRPRGPRNT